MKANWQKPPGVKPPEWRDGYRDLTIYAVNLGIRVRFFPFLADGSIDPTGMAEFERAMADKDTGATHPSPERLLKLIYRLADHFDAKQINLISGYREPEDATESHHADASAADFMIPGVPLAAVARVARRFGHVGVGFYPVSGFIHMDVRSGSSFFWADRSGPGKGSCMVRIMKSHIPGFDRKWKPADDEPVPRRNKKGELRGATALPAEPTPLPNPDSPDKKST